MEESERGPWARQKHEFDALERGDRVADWQEQETYYMAPALLGWENDAWDASQAPPWYKAEG